MQGNTFDDMLRQARTAPDVPRLVNGVVQRQAAALDYAQEQARLRERLNSAAPPVPNPLVAPTPVIVPPKAVPPAGFGNEFTQLSGQVMALLAEYRAGNTLTREILNRMETSLRLSWIGEIGDDGSEPTSITIPQLSTYNPTGGGGFDGGGGAAPYTGTVGSAPVYLPWFKNTRQYPIGVRFVAYFNTPGVGLKFSMSGSDAARFATLSNAANGQSQTGVKKLLPNETVFAANVDTNTPLTNNDVFLIQVFDPRQFLEKQFYGGEPWKGA